MHTGIAGAPVRMTLDVLFEWDTQPILTIRTPLDPATVILASNLIRWEGDFSEGPKHFHAIVQQTFQNHVEGYATRIDISDSLGGHLVADFHHLFTEQGWKLPGFPFYTFGHMVSQTSTGKFGAMLSANGQAVSYHDEP